MNGGAIAIGHPLGMSGARLTVTLLHELRRRGGRYGIATMCVGVGQGQAALFERAGLTVAERYLELGLRLGRHVDGLVDAYYGPPELQAQVDAEEPRRAGRARRRRRGAPRRARGRLARGPGARAARRTPACSRATRSPTATRSSAATACVRCARRTPSTSSPTPSSTSCCRERGRSSSGARPGAPATSAPASAPSPCSTTSSRSCGRGRSRSSTFRTASGSRSRRSPTSPGGRSTTTRAISRAGSCSNIDLPTGAADLIHLAAHEVYPGHHTEHALKEQLLLRDRGLIEEGIQLVPTPQAVLSEGIAEAGEEIVLDDAAREEAYAIVRRHGVETPDVGQAPRIATALEALRTVGRRRGAPHPRGRRAGRGGAALRRALGARHARAGRAERSLRDRPDLACLRDHVLRRPRPLPRLHGRRPRPVPPAPHGARTHRRAPLRGVSRYRWAVLGAGTFAQTSYSAIWYGVAVIAPASAQRVRTVARGDRPPHLDVARRLARDAAPVGDRHRPGRRAPGAASSALPAAVRRSSRPRSRTSSPCSPCCSSSPAPPVRASSPRAAAPSCTGFPGQRARPRARRPADGRAALRLPRRARAAADPARGRPAVVVRRARARVPRRCGRRRRRPARGAPAGRGAGAVRAVRRRSATAGSGRCRSAARS